MFLEKKEKKKNEEEEEKLLRRFFCMNGLQKENNMKMRSVIYKDPHLIANKVCKLVSARNSKMDQNNIIRVRHVFHWCLIIDFVYENKFFETISIHESDLVYLEVHFFLY